MIRWRKEPIVWTTTEKIRSSPLTLPFSSSEGGSFGKWKLDRFLILRPTHFTEWYSNSKFIGRPLVSGTLREGWWWCRWVAGDENWIQMDLISTTHRTWPNLKVWLRYTTHFDDDSRIISLLLFLSICLVARVHPSGVDGLLAAGGAGWMVVEMAHQLV